MANSPPPPRCVLGELRSGHLHSQHLRSHGPDAGGRGAHAGAAESALRNTVGECEWCDGCGWGSHVTGT